MPEYVYALHNFAPEHEDEIAFEAGQPIEVVEKDDQYNDGWWQVSTPPALLSFPKHPACVRRTRGLHCVPTLPPLNATLTTPLLRSSSHPRCH